VTRLRGAIQREVARVRQVTGQGRAALDQSAATVQQDVARTALQASG
jgi:ribosomal protein S19E (S16A)